MSKRISWVRIIVTLIMVVSLINILTFLAFRYDIPLLPNSFCKDRSFVTYITPGTIIPKCPLGCASKLSYSPDVRNTPDFTPDCHGW